MEVASVDPEDLDDFLSKVNQVSDLIKDIKSGDDKQAAISAADEYIQENTDRVTSDRTVINHTPAAPPPEPLPPGTTPEQAAFMRSIETDARERNERRVKREADALIPKEKGNVAFKSGDYEAALEHYLEASRTDPASPAIYTNCAQAFLKLGKFEEAAEKADWAIRADERWIKGYLRMGIAQRALGQYTEAIATFKAGHGFALPKDRVTFDRHIEDTTLAQALSAREAKLQEANSASGDAADRALKMIELGCSKFQHSALDPKGFMVGAEMMGAVIETELHQDFFRLRGGVGLFRDVPTFRATLQEMATSGAGTPPAATAEGDGTIDAVRAAVKLLVTAIRGNEASRREFVQRGQSDVEMLVSMIASRHLGLVADALRLTSELAESPRVTESLLKATGAKAVPVIVAAIVGAGGTGESAAAAAVAEPGLAALAKLSKLPAGSRGVCAEFPQSLGPYLQGQLEGGATAAKAVTAMMSLAGDPAVRARLADPTAVKLLAARIADPKVDVVEVPNTLGLLCNLCLEAPARELLQHADMVEVVLSLLQSGTSAVVARSAQLVSRLCTSAQFAGQLVGGNGLARLIRAKRTKDEFDEEILDAAVRTMTKCLRLVPAARGVVNECGGIIMLLPALKAQSAALIGNAALCIADLAQDKSSCAAVADSTVVADLLGLARKDKSAMTENCAIALSRLAAGHPAHLARLRSLDGFEVLHSRAPGSVKST